MELIPQGSETRVLALISLVGGVASALLIGNDDLALSGPDLVPDIVASGWRYTFGLLLWVGAASLNASWIAFRLLPGPHSPVGRRLRAR